MKKPHHQYILFYQIVLYASYQPENWQNDRILVLLKLHDVNSSAKHQQIISSNKAATSYFRNAKNKIHLQILHG